jgi:hypothetical protein
MRITVTLDEKAINRFAAGLQTMGSKGRTVMANGLKNGGDKVRTAVRKALKEQTSAKRAGAINKNTRSYLDRGALEYAITATDKGLPITEFPTRFSRKKNTLVRWSAREHWRLQHRDARGRFGKLEHTEEAAVAAMVWGSLHRFQRSFNHPERGPVMQRVAGKPGLRKLYGPNLAKEIGRDDSLATFMREAPKVQDEIVKRLQGLLTG